MEQIGHRTPALQVLDNGQPELRIGVVANARSGDPQFTCAGFRLPGRQPVLVQDIELDKIGLGLADGVLVADQLGHELVVVSLVNL